MRWWTWLLSTVRSNTRSATLYYLELDTPGVSRPASIGCTVISGHSFVRNRSRQSIMSESIVLHRQEDNALVDMVAGRSVLQYSISYLVLPRT